MSTPNFLINQQLIKMVDEYLSAYLSQHIRWRTTISKDICYTGKVIKIAATNQSKDDPQYDDEITVDIRYTRESALVVIPINNSININNNTNNVSIEEEVNNFNEYLQTQLFLTVQRLNQILR